MDHKHPATPEARTVNEYNNKVKQEDRCNKGAAISLLRKITRTMKTKIEERHGTSRALNGKRNDSSHLDDSEAVGPGRGKTNPNTHISNTKPEEAFLVRVFQEQEVEQVYFRTRKPRQRR